MTVSDKKRVLIISGSPRVGGNTDILASAFEKGAREAGHQVVKMSVAGKKLNGCMACDYCVSHEGRCVQNDDVQPFLAAMGECDVLVIASPIYFFGLSAQVCAILHRLYTHNGKKYPITETALLLTYGDDHVEVAQPAIEQHKSTAAYLGWKNHGVIAVGETMEKGDINKYPEVLARAEAMGRSL